MPGLFDNQNGCYVNLTEIEQGDWFSDQDRQLYIIPLDGDSFGPDDEIMDKIEKAYREKGQLSDNDMKRLGLEKVLPVLKRFSPDRGYYVA